MNTFWLLSEENKHACSDMFDDFEEDVEEHSEGYAITRVDMSLIQLLKMPMNVLKSLRGPFE